MPVFEFTSPDGKSYEVTGPAGSTKEQAFALLQSQIAQQKKPSGLEDAAKGFGSGIMDAITGAVTPALKMAAPAYNLIESAFNGQKAPADHAALLPSQDALPNAISNATGANYQPQTVPGQYAKTAGEFLPNAAIPGGIGARLARVLAPALASETAGQATKGKPYEGAARLAAALAGGGAEGAGEGFLNRTPGTPAPSLSVLTALKNQTYDAANKAGVVIKPQSFKQFAADISTSLPRDNVVQADLHKNALAALSTIQEEAASGAPISLSRADAIRQTIGNAAEKAAGPEGNGGDERLVGKVKSAFDAYLDGLTPKDVVSGDPSTAVPILKDARDLAQRSFKATEIQKLIDLAKNNASVNYSASGEDQALRVQFKNLNAKLIKDPSAAAGFTDAERDAIRKVAQGGPIENGLRWLGKFAPTGVVSSGAGAGLGAFIGSSLAGPPGAAVGAAALPAAGGAARYGANALTNRNAALAGALMRAGPNAPSITPGPMQMPATLQKQLLLSGLLSQVGQGQQ